MKSKLLSILTLALIMSVSCSDEDSKVVPGLGSGTGEQSVVSLTIYDGTSNKRSAGTDTDPANPDESTIDLSSGIKVVVFDDDTQIYPKGGALTLTLTETSPGSGIYQSDEFTVTSGEKYFYIFANDASSFISIPSATLNRSEFIKRQIEILLDGADELNIQDPNFLMGSLWSEKVMAPGGGVPGTPMNINLTIGRLASKITLNDVSKGTTTMLGNFSGPVYRLGTIPKKIFYVGNNDESRPAPPALNHGVVVSAVHMTSPYTGPSDANYQQYTSTWKNVNNTLPEPFYTVENTTQPDKDGIQYYGNTSYIQIRTTYTPDNSEVYNVADLSPKGSFTGPTFYTANLISNGARIIFEDDPRVGGAIIPDADIDQNSIQIYTNGLNYHKFPIHDPESGLPDVQKNAVLRNHSYHYKVTSIADIGEPDEDVDPIEPIENQTTLEIEVRIAPWYKIENNNVPI